MPTSTNPDENYDAYKVRFPFLGKIFDQMVEAVVNNRSGTEIKRNILFRIFQIEDDLNKQLDRNPPELEALGLSAACKMVTLLDVYPAIADQIYREDIESLRVLSGEFSKPR